MTAPPVTDPVHQADMLEAFEPASLAALLDQFLTAIEKESASIIASEAVADTAGMEEAAHRLASAASQFGFPELAAVARAIELGRSTSEKSGLKECLARAKAAAEALQRRPTDAR